MKTIPESWLKIGYNILFTLGFALTWPYSLISFGDDSRFGKDWERGWVTTLRI